MSRETPLHASSPVDPPLPADFVSRCLQGLRGAVQDKVILANWLTEIVAQANPADLKLIDLMQQLVFGANPADLTVDLPEPQLALWQQIVTGLSKGD